MFCQFYEGKFMLLYVLALRRRSCAPLVLRRFAELALQA